MGLMGRRPPARCVVLLFPVDRLVNDPALWRSSLKSKMSFSIFEKHDSCYVATMTLPPSPTDCARSRFRGLWGTRIEGAQRPTDEWLPATLRASRNKRSGAVQGRGPPPSKPRQGNFPACKPLKSHKTAKQSRLSRFDDQRRAPPGCPARGHGCPAHVAAQSGDMCRESMGGRVS